MYCIPGIDEKEQQVKTVINSLVSFLHSFGDTPDKVSTSSRVFVSLISVRIIITGCPGSLLWEPGQPKKIRSLRANPRAIAKVNGSKVPIFKKVDCDTKSTI